MTIHQTLSTAVKKLKQKNIPSAHLDAEVLLLEALNKNRRAGTQNFVSLPFLYSHSDYELNRNEERVFNSFISRRLKREPVAYIVGHKEFFGLDFIVNENVLIPRPETEIIVEEVLKIIQTALDPSLPRRGKSISRHSQKFDLIDVGTGSGCILISVLGRGVLQYAPTKIKNCCALDISPEAIKIAKRNTEIILGKNHKIKFIAGDFLKMLNKKNLNNSRDLIITANLPYLSKEEYQKTQPEIKNFEPKTALAAPQNGAGLIKKLLQKIAACRGGSRPAPTQPVAATSQKTVFIFLEIDPSQTKDITKFIKETLPSSKIKIIKDLAKKNRVIKIKIR